LATQVDALPEDMWQHGKTYQPPDQDAWSIIDKDDGVTTIQADLSG